MTSDASPFAIETRGLTRRFGKSHAVDHLDLRVAPGTVYGFIGPNGAGKSTTIRMLMGLLRPTDGVARVLGQRVAGRAESVKHRIGYVPEEHRMYGWMRVHEIIGFCRRFYANWDDAQCAMLVDRFGLPRDRKVKHLSKGMRVKLALLLAVAHGPDLLILDEPTSGLDPLVREEFLDGVLRTICDGARTVLFSSHTLSDVQRLADRVGLLHEGRLLADCATDELVSGTKRIRAVLREGARPDARPAGTIWDQFERREWLPTVRGFRPGMLAELRATNAVENIEVFDLGLEDVFKDYVRGRKVSA